MATLKGQNFRILQYDDTSHYYFVVGMSTNCTITLTNNTDNGSHKDITGIADSPTVVTKGWGVQVDSLDVSNVASLLSGMKEGTKFKLMWSEMTGANNQTIVSSSFSRTGYALLNDLTASFNNRENSAKNLQFAGSGPLETITGTPTSVPVAIAGYTKGQFVRLFLSSNNNDTPSKVIASARQLSFHCSLGIEESSTKDTTGTWQYQEATSLSYDISTQALVRGNDTITSEVLANGLNELEEIYEAGNPVRWSICNVSGDNNRTKGSSIVSGSCIISNLQINAQDRTAASYQASLLGYGVYNFGT